MKANSLHEGELYAYAEGGYKRQGTNPLPLNCAKVKYLANKQHVPMYGQRARTVCIVEMVESSDWRYPAGKVYEVPARHLIDFWDHYQEERDTIIAKKKESANKFETEGEQRRARRDNIKNRLAEHFGIPVTNIRVSSLYIELRTKDIEKWLDEISPPQEVEEEVANNGDTPKPDLMEGIQGLIEGKF